MTLSLHKSKAAKKPSRTGHWLLLAALLLTLSVYWSGLHGGWLFDDYPNIVDNTAVQPEHATLPSLVGAALSSPSSEFKRPLSTLSFAVNFLTTGLDPFWMKLTNVVIHLLNGMLVFLLAGALIPIANRQKSPPFVERASTARLRTDERDGAGCSEQSVEAATAHADARLLRDTETQRAGIIAAIIATGWMLLPINLTGVLYVVQRMESLANLFVMLGLLGYVAGRKRMLDSLVTDGKAQPPSATRGFLICVASLILATGIGVLAKETAVMLPMYALLIEWLLFRFETPAHGKDRKLVALFLLVLVVPMLLGLAWLLPSILQPQTWAARDFTLGTRLLSEARIVADYVRWTLLPTPAALSFYHDDFQVSTGLLAPWTTFPSILVLAALMILMLGARRRQPLIALGIALFLGCQLLTGTILPLELIYEHRNYFASFGLLLALIPLLAVPSSHKMALPRHVLLAGLLLCWTGLTAITAYTWGNPLRLAIDLAARAPQSPRAQYELGRTYIVHSHYDPSSPFTRLAYPPLERALRLPDSSILPEQALIFMNARMHLPLKDTWWDSMIAKLKARKSTVQDESSLAALTKCAYERSCLLPKSRMVDAFLAALSHPDPSARLLATYGDYAWNVLDDHPLGLHMIEQAVKTSPHEPAYRVTLVRMLLANGQKHEAQAALHALGPLNVGGRLDASINKLKQDMGSP